ncbi:MAG: redoxin domain-containing protein [Candidatus Omnitrophica bacterium]|nr:redoxin domain-containing protein [Candidatus Omnitrophota bacterium]
MASFFPNQSTPKKRKIESAVLALCILLLIFSISYAANQYSKERQEIAQTNVQGKIRAPELEGGLGWLNVEKPLRLADLRGKIVLLDFWTYCCINCMHVIPDLKKLEKKYPNELVVIGVHSAKFLNEKETDNIRSAVLRYEIEHPVVNDADFKIWRQYGARGWPHLVVIDPEGYVVGAVSGEGNFLRLDQTIQYLIRKYHDKINYVPIKLSLEKDKEPPTFLSFPGKILADEQSDRLFIADSNHNRIVVTDLQGKVLDIAGAGSIGLQDGSFEEAQFNHPQGMTHQDGILYVADTENHLLRRLDLTKRIVDTLAGTGKQAAGRAPGGPALRTDLNSPWDLEIVDGDPNLYIAMAGPHQLWMYDPSSKTVRAYAGSGREDIIDGPLDSAALAQPSGLTSDGRNLIFADSEVSALRWVDRSQKIGRVKTYIGSGLFDFGDRDGAFQQALLQHPLGVCLRGGVVYIADAYNHKIKAADLQSQTIQTLAGNGKPGLGTPDNPQFNEPSGLSVAGNLLYVADANNHAVRVINLETGRTDTLMFDLSEWYNKSGGNRFEVFGDPPNILPPRQKLAAGGSVKITFDMPPNYHLNPAMRPIVQCKISASGSEWISRPYHPAVDGGVIQFDLDAGSIDAPESIAVSVTYYYCRKDNQGQCMIGSLLIEGKAQPGVELTSLHHVIEP